jgi:hypothetical protein
MKYRNLTTEFIMTLDKDGIREARWTVGPVSTNVKKGLKKIEARPVATDADAKELAGARRQVARAAELSEAIACREDEIYGPGVLTSYDHTERFC